MQTIGEQLKQARLAKGLTLEQASEATRVRPHYLQALESDQRSALPSTVQGRGFLRLYADYLGLPVAQLLAIWEGRVPVPEADGALVLAQHAQGLAVLATAGAIKQAESIAKTATEQRNLLNNEMSGVAEKINGLVIGFPTKAGETGKLYGSITHQMIADEISKRAGVTVERRQIECQPIRVLGEHKCSVRLTVDLNPEVRVIAHREGEVPAALAPKAEPVAEAAPVEEAPAETAEEATEA